MFESLFSRRQLLLKVSGDGCRGGGKNFFDSQITSKYVFSTLKKFFKNDFQFLRPKRSLFSSFDFMFDQHKNAFFSSQVLFQAFSTVLECFEWTFKMEV